MISGSRCYELDHTSVGGGQPVPALEGEFPRHPGRCSWRVISVTPSAATACLTPSRRLLRTLGALQACRPAGQPIMVAPGFLRCLGQVVGGMRAPCAGKNPGRRAPREGGRSHLAIRRRQIQSGSSFRGQGAPQDHTVYSPDPLTLADAPAFAAPSCSGTARARASPIQRDAGRRRLKTPWCDNSASAALLGQPVPAGIAIKARTSVR